MSGRYYSLSEPSVQAFLEEGSAHGRYSGKLCACISLLIGALIPVTLHHRALRNTAGVPGIHLPWHLPPLSLGPMMHWVPEPDEPQRLRSPYGALFGLPNLSGSLHDVASHLRYPFHNSQDGSQEGSQDFLQAERKRIEAAVQEVQAKKKAAIEAEQFDVAHGLKQEELRLKAQLEGVTRMQQDVTPDGLAERSVQANRTTYRDVTPDALAERSAQAKRTTPAAPLFKELSAAGDLPGANVDQYSMHSFAMKSHAGPDGKTVTERHVASAVGDGSRGIYEARHLYSDSNSLGKASHEQHLGERSRMTIGATIGNTSTFSQVVHGMNETDKQAFHQDFETGVKYTLHRAELSHKDLESTLTNDFHKYGGYRKLAAWLDQDDFWESPYHEAALPSFDEDKELHSGTHHNFFLQPLRHGSRYRIPMA